MTDRLMERLSAADPAAAIADAPPPSLERVAAARRRRASRTSARVGGSGLVLAVAAILALALPGGRDGDVIAQAAAAVSGPEVLHTVAAIRGQDGRAETWRAPDGDQRTVLYDADGAVIAELVLRDGRYATWNAAEDTISRGRDTSLDDDPLTLLGQARAGRPGVTQRADTTVQGIPVHVIALEPTTAGEDPVPERVYFVDKETFLPVRIQFGETVTDVLEAETMPRGEAPLTMSAH